MLLRLFPVFFIISICAATFIVSFILFYLHAGPRLLVGRPHSFTYFPLIGIEAKRLKIIDISESMLNEIVQNQFQFNTSTKPSINEDNNNFRQHASNEGKNTMLQSSQGNTIKNIYNTSKAKHFEMHKPMSVEAMFIDHQRNRKLVKSEFETVPDWVPKSSHISLPFGLLANGNLKTDKQDSATAWETEQAHRRKRIRTTCDGNAQMNHLDIDTLIGNRQLLTNFLVDDEHELIYCYVPKVACTQWKRLFITLLGKNNAKRPDDIPHMIVHYKSGIPVLGSKQYSDSGIRWRLGSYTKFVFSRHPFERILSAYRDKFESNSTEAHVFNRLYGHSMIRALGGSRRTDFSLSFTDMLSYLSKVPSTSFQEHWKPIYHLCHPCSIEYTFIGSFDDLERDSNNILNRTAKLRTTNPRFPSVLQSNTPKLVRKYLAKVPLNVTMQARKIYQMDFDLFGYK